MKKIFALTIGVMLFEMPALASTNGYYRGDLDGNKILNVADLTALVSSLHKSGEKPKAADVNGDGKVDTDDVDVLAEMIIGMREKVWVALPDNISKDNDKSSGDVDDTEFNGVFDSKKK